MSQQQQQPQQQQPQKQQQQRQQQQQKKRQHEKQPSNVAFLGQEQLMAQFPQQVERLVERKLEPFVAAQERMRSEATQHQLQPSQCCTRGCGDSRGSC